MYQTIELILGLLIAVTGLAVLAPKLPLPFPILLVLSGIAIEFVPGVPKVSLDPDLVFLFFLPPLLYEAAAFTSWHEFRANLRPISLLAVGLVLVTTLAVALVAHAVIPGLPWPAAFVLGAIVSPPDAVAATALFRRLGVPRQMVTIVEGENLVNDATGLVLYQMAVAATLTGAFSLSEAILRFLINAMGGIAIGLSAGWVAAGIRRHLDNPPAEIMISLLAPYAAYLPAERLEVSGVLAVVALGLYMGRQLPRISSSESRLQADAVWVTVGFALNGLIFLLIGLELPLIMLGARTGHSFADLAFQASAVILTVIGIRLLWIFPAVYVPRRLSRRLREREPAPSWQILLVMGWSGMRGVVSLAAALALPWVTLGGIPFPERDLILFLTSCVIFATLILQGLSLPALIVRLGIIGDSAADREEVEARLKVAEAALAHVETLAAETQVSDEIAERLRRRYEERLQHLEEVSEAENGNAVESPRAEYEHAKREVLSAEHSVLLELRDQGELSEETARRIQREIDLEESRLGRKAEPESDDSSESSA